MQRLILSFLSGLMILMLMLNPVNAKPTDNMTVKILNPVTGDRIAECDDYVIHVDAKIQTGTIKDIKFFRNGASFYVDKKEPYETTWKSPVSGYYALYVVATDDKANKVTSDTVYFRFGNVQEGDLLLNGEFSCVLAPWSLANNQGAASTWNLNEAESWLSEGKILNIEIQNGGTANWHVQLAQPVPIHQGHTYMISFGADAFETKAIDLSLQENKEPWTVYWNQAVTVEKADIFGPYTFDCNVEDPYAYLRFNVGGNTTMIFFDAIQVIDPSVEFISVDSRVPDNGAVKSFDLSQNYPNPFNASTMIQYTLAEGSRVEMDIFNMTGQKVRTLVKDVRQAGTYQAFWDGADSNGWAVTSGTYICKLTARVFNNKVAFVGTRKLVLVK